MVWVRSEYAGELAVLSAWLSLLIPWNVTLAPNVFEGGDALFIRFPLFQLRYTLGFVIPPSLTRGIRLTPRLLVMDPLTSLAFQETGQQAMAYLVWTVGAGVITVAFLLSVAYYFAEDLVEQAPVDPVRVMGFLLGLAGLDFLGATYYLLQGGFPGVPIPLGVLFLFAFSGILLTVDRTEFHEEDAADATGAG